MRLHTPTKIIFIILGLMVIAALVFITVEYQKLKQQPVQPTVIKSSLRQPVGTCSPDLAKCQDSPELCMQENKNQVCD